MSAAAASTVGGPALFFGSVALALGLPAGVVWGSFGLASGAWFTRHPEAVGYVATSSGHSVFLLTVGLVVLVLLLLYPFGWDFGMRMGWWSAHGHHGGHGDHAAHDEHGDHDDHHDGEHEEKLYSGPDIQYGSEESRLKKLDTTGDGGGRNRGRRRH